MATARVFRLAIPVDNIESAVAFYSAILGQPGERVWSNRHYFHCGEVVLACLVPGLDGRDCRPSADPRIIYFAVGNLENMLARLRDSGASELDAEIEMQPWGERSFYAKDPFGNRLCFVDEPTVYIGEKHEM